MDELHQSSPKKQDDRKCYLSNKLEVFTIWWYYTDAMKKILLLLPMLASVASAETLFSEWLDDTSALAQELSNEWRHELPDTGMIPSFLSAEYVSRMRERHGGSSLSWQQYSLCLPLADPRRSGGEKWMFNASINADVTLLETSGNLDVKHNDLYHFSIPVSVIVPRQNDNVIILAASPSFDSDFAQSAHSFHMNLMASYRIQHSETFNYSVGLAYAPYAGAWNVMPVFSFDWQMTPEWTLSMSGYSIRAMRDMGQGLSLGAFVQGEGGSWAVEMPQGTRLLRVRSLVAGLTSEYDFSHPGQSKRVVSLSAGCVLTTAVDVCEFNADRDRDESHHYQPGFYVSGSVDFRF